MTDRQSFLKDISEKSLIWPLYQKRTDIVILGGWTWETDAACRGVRRFRLNLPRKRSKEQHVAFVVSQVVTVLAYLPQHAIVRRLKTVRECAAVVAGHDGHQRT